MCPPPGSLAWAALPCSRGTGAHCYRSHCSDPCGERTEAGPRHFTLNHLTSVHVPSTVQGPGNGGAQGSFWELAAGSSWFLGALQSTEEVGGAPLVKDGD